MKRLVELKIKQNIRSFQCGICLEQMGYEVTFGDYQLLPGDSRFYSDGPFVAVLKCNNCWAPNLILGGVRDDEVGHVRINSIEKAFYAEEEPNVLRATYNQKDREGVLVWLNIYGQYPTSLPGELYNKVPQPIVRYLEEAGNCLAIKALNASSAMCRKVIEEIAKDKGLRLDHQNKLHNALDQLKAEGVITPKQYDYFVEIKEWGNLAVHDTLPVKLEDAKKLYSLILEIVLHMYDDPQKKMDITFEQLKRGRNKVTKIYNPSEVESKWQQTWEETGLYRQAIDKSRPKHYALTMLPYPSGDLHIGHWYAMTPSDARARFMRMKGYNVLFPMGFDAFGLPAENAAIKNKIHPKTWTYANIERMRAQLRSMGAMFDWQREAVSSDPGYYKWTQWFFKKLMEQGLAYRKLSAVDFCPNCNTTLAREQVWGEDRHCERCGTPVIKKDLEQWFFKTTDYAEELLDFSGIDWPERVITMQTNWIGRSTGANVVFKTEHGDEMPVFTTRPDTLWGATFMVMAPEHPLVEKLTTDAQRAEVEAYRQAAERMSDIDRETADREKTGVFTGSYAINPVNDARIPIWIADYVLMGYGSGAIMAVPAHDERDFAFAAKFGLDIVEVIRMPGRSDADGPLQEAYTTKTDGHLVNSGPFNGAQLPEAIDQVIAWLEEKGIGEGAVNYRLRDWLISRQRYWGAPIPVIYCPEHGAVPVPDEELPVLLPQDVEFMPTGESPLKFHDEFLHTVCPECGQPALRETDTMDTFMCSSWYQYRYLSPNDDAHPFDPEEGAYWLPVDQYTGGIEHATMHLIYTRFFTKAMREMGLVDFDEPMLALYNQGMVLGEDGEKMSKSRGNVVAPDALVAQYGADTVRTYLMFFSKWDQGGPWNYDGIKGPQRLMNDVWAIATHDYAPGKVDQQANRNLRRKVHQTMRKVTQDMEGFSFNTAVAAIMELRNTITDAQKAANVSVGIWNEAVDSLLLLLAPIAPHVSEELWAQRGHAYSIHQRPWPQWDEEAAREDVIEVVIQINGKVRDKLEVEAGADDETLKSLALGTERIQELLAGKQPRKVIVVRGRLVNIVA